MLIGVPKEIKDQEYRVGLSPASVTELCQRGHRVMVESGAGVGIGAGDEAYRLAGAEIADSAQAVFASAEMIVKVKEPQAVERAMLRESQILYTYLHLAPDPDQTRDLIDSGAVCIAYETVTSPHGGLPLLRPMSEVAGRLSVQAAARAMEKSSGGAGRLMGGVPGVDPAKVVVIGGGVVGTHAIHIAMGMGADVWVLDRSNDALRALWQHFGRGLNTVYSTADAIAHHVRHADVVIGGVLVPGALAPKLVTAEHIKMMKPGTVVVDVAIDQGGCFATSHATTHTDPTYVVDDVIHYCVANMPGAVPMTSTHALNNAILDGAIALADKGYKQALLDDVHLRNGLNVCHGKVCCQAVADNLGYDYVDALDMIG